MKMTTKPSLLDDAPMHKEALQNGFNHLTSWVYNVVDDFKNLSKEQIKAQLKATAFPYAVCFENVINDFNMATGIRNANAFNAREIFYIGDKRFDRRGMCGVHNYSDLKWLASLDDLVALKKEYVFVGIDNVAGSIPISSHCWKKNTLMIFGSEGVGLTPVTKKMCDAIVHINQFGSVRSLNVGTASGIIMHDFINRYEK